MRSARGDSFRWNRYQWWFVWRVLVFWTSCVIGGRWQTRGDRLRLVTKNWLCSVENCSRIQPKMPILFDLNFGMGDINNHADRLKQLLKKIKYPQLSQFEDLAENNPAYFLQMIHYTLIDFDASFYKGVLEKNYELYSKNDLRFIEQVYKLLIKEYNYKPQLTIAQFLSDQFIEHKMILVNDVIQIVTRSRKPTIRHPKQHFEEVEEPEIPQLPQPAQQEYKVVKHEDPLSYPEVSHRMQRMEEPRPAPEKRFHSQTQPAIQHENESNYPPSVLQQPSTLSPSTQLDLKKMMEIITLSNHNQQVFMTKFTEFQVEVVSHMNKLNARVQFLESQLMQRKQPKFDENYDPNF